MLMASKWYIWIPCYLPRLHCVVPYWSHGVCQRVSMWSLKWTYHQNFFFMYSAALADIYYIFQTSHITLLKLPLSAVLSRKTAPSWFRHSPGQHLLPRLRCMSRNRMIMQIWLPVWFFTEEEETEQQTDDGAQVLLLFIKSKTIK